MRYAMLFLLLLSSIVSADAYKCKGANGKAVFTATQCDVGETRVSSAKSDGTDAASFNQAQADLQRQKDWLAGRAEVQRRDASIAQRQSSVASLPSVPEPQHSTSDSIWNRPWGCMWRSCSSSKTITH